MRGLEAEVAHDQRQERQKELKASGMSAEDAKASAMASQGWALLKVQQAEESFHLIAAELEKVRDWRLKGANEDVTPATPALDRLDGLAKAAKFEGPLALEIVKLTKDRNFAAHHPP